MSASMEREDVADIAKSTGLSEKEIIEIIELVGPNRSSVIREAAILKRSLEMSGYRVERKSH